ncbi:MAG: hypothetical protein WBC63_09890 [Candidatus Bipolaricaulia bacterium]
MDRRARRDRPRSSRNLGTPPVEFYDSLLWWDSPTTRAVRPLHSSGHTKGTGEKEHGLMLRLAVPIEALLSVSTAHVTANQGAPRRRFDPGP